MNRRLPLALLCAVALVAVPLVSHASTPWLRHAEQVSKAHNPQPGQAAALARQVAQPIPARNLYQLADQLKLRPPRKIARVIRTTSPNYAVGHEDSLWVLSEDTNKFFHVRARIVAESPHLYLYLQDGVKADTTAAQHAVDHFEHSIYPTDRAFFGSEWRPGVDGDPHITCLVADLRSSGVGGYYSAEDEYPRDVYRYSNQREMIYMNSGAGMPGDSGFLLTLSHEFQHMIHEHMHPHDNAWLNEGMSMLAEQVNNYPPEGEPSAFVNQFDTQLNGWSMDSRTYAHYGAAYLYLAYLYDRFGRSFIHDMVRQPAYTDFELVNDVLRRHHIHLTADQVFAQWVIANLVHDHTLAGGVYGYKHLAWKIDNLSTKLTPTAASTTARVAPYAAQYIQVELPSNGHALSLHFSAPATLPIVSADGAPFWWSNRGDMSDTRIERDVNLTHVHRASLHFRTWYDIEKDYDYGYVEVSTDGGTTWQTVRGTLTTNRNPTGANYGNGYTGNSKGWHNEVVDLSRFAGRRIKLRLAYVTDDEYTGQGMLVGDIRIPEIGYRDTFTGWQQHGWIPVPTNAVPVTWVVQLVEYTSHGVQIRHMHVTGGHGSAVIQPVKVGLQRLVVELHETGIAKSSVKSTYRLSAGY